MASPQTYTDVWNCIQLIHVHNYHNDTESVYRIREHFRIHAKSILKIARREIEPKNRILRELIVSILRPATARPWFGQAIHNWPKP